MSACTVGSPQSDEHRWSRADIDNRRVYTADHIYKAWPTSLMLLAAADAAAADDGVKTLLTQPLHYHALVSPTATHKLL